ncbi:hypothetical protein OsJ_33100 [Oryza sativa Japonica Group]|uniref:Uncharacterized protein n=1 Tax=Oryza sativa subsp. japonica TaxID=39947 RepID=A3C900_ORYSJ|nr:hypothetical protein OsJ_33100 [Oryza sativa Japonica Group]
MALAVKLAVLLLLAAAAAGGSSTTTVPPLEERLGAAFDGIAAAAEGRRKGEVICIGKYSYQVFMV